MVFHWSLRDSKSPLVSRTLLSILAVLNHVVIWMISTRPPTSKSFSPFSNPLVIVPNAPIKIGIIVTFMFHSFFNSLARSRDLSFFSPSFSFILWSAGTTKSTILQVLFFLLIIIRSGLLATIRWSVCMSKSHRSLLLLFTLLEFFTSVLSDGFSLEFEWQRVSTGLQDSFQYSGRSQLSFGYSLPVRQLPSPPGLLIIL